MLAHNYYGSAAASGENRVFEEERELLRKRGHEVNEFVRYSDEIRTRGVLGLLKGAFATPWNPWSASAIKRKVDSFHPDVLHVHNTFPLLSPSIFHSVGSCAARVLTLHNYRLFCPAAIPMREDKVCTECMDRKTVWPSLRNGCYRNSHLATVPLAINVLLNRWLRTWENQVDAFVVLSEFQRGLMIKAGLSAELVHVKPNFYPGVPDVVPWEERGPSVVFAGRLTAEKGVKVLIQAWQMWGDSAPELRIVGDGAMRNELERMVAASQLSQVHFLGQISSDEAQAEIARARLLVLPSICFEGFPMVVREAFALGTPAAVSNIGPLPSIVHSGYNGVVFTSGDPSSLFEVISSVFNSDVIEGLAQGARRSFLDSYTDEANYRKLMEIYEQAIGVSRRKRFS